MHMCMISVQFKRFIFLKLEQVFKKQQPPLAVIVSVILTNFLIEISQCVC